MDGILNLDKPMSISSQAAVTRVKKALAVKKAGHAGTLDPEATGVLLVCMGKATKLFEPLQTHEKEYLAELTLGVETDSHDASGQITAEREVPTLNEADIERALAPFRGVIQQTPPMFSALKHKGRPLYAYAREGITIERKPREVKVSALEPLDCQPPTLKIRCVCSRGAYIRVLAHDIGRKLGCGAHIKALRRTRIGPYRVEDAVSLEALENNPAAAVQRIVPLETARRAAS